MCKYYSAALYSLLFLGLLCTSGCQVAGGGGMFYGPPNNIICEKPWDITVKYVVVPIDPKEKFGKLTERYKNVTIHLRDSVNSDFVAVPMVVESANSGIGELQMKADMKPIPCNSGIEYVEYYIDCMFNGVYNRTKLYRVPISKN
ncbi:MAG: hypothetical protein ABSG82_03180 [Sedimentisphaerales bacterium]|jgi:hypothetical protein